MSNLRGKKAVGRHVQTADMLSVRICNVRQITAAFPQLLDHERHARRKKVNPDPTLFVNHRTSSGAVFVESDKPLCSSSLNRRPIKLDIVVLPKCAGRIEELPGIRSRRLHPEDVRPRSRPRLRIIVRRGTRKQKIEDPLLHLDVHDDLAVRRRVISTHAITFRSLSDHYPYPCAQIESGTGAPRFRNAPRDYHEYRLIPNLIGVA